MKRWIPKGEFARNVLTVMSGTALAQAIPVLISPLLTRLYTPADLGAMALYLSIVAIAVVVATGRYELAILIPARDREARDLVWIATGLAALLCLAAVPVLLLLSSAFVDDFAQRTHLGAWVYVLPLSVLLTAVFQSASYWLNRRTQYKRIVASRVAQSSAMCTAQLAGGVVQASSSGLILGHVVGQLAACALVLKSLRFRISAPKWPRLIAVAKRHRHFPSYLVPGHLANVASSQMPVLMLSVLFGPAIAGFYSLAERVLVLPSSIIGTAIGDVYRQQAALQYSSQGNCRALYLRTAKKLALMAAGPCLLAVLLAPWFFSLVFGAFWREAGEITAVMAIMVFFQIVSSPLSQTVLLANMHRLDMIWQMARLMLSVGSIYLGHVLSGGYWLSIILYAASFALLHVVHSLLQYKAACGTLPFFSRSTE